MNAAIEAYQSLAQHEAAHAAAGLMLNMDVRWAHLDDDKPAGHVTIADGYDHDPQSAAIMLIAAAIADGHTDPADDDGHQLQELIDVHGVDRNLATKQALQLTATRQFERLQLAIAHLLEQRGHLDEHALHKIKAFAEGKTVEHTTKAATANRHQRPGRIHRPRRHLHRRPTERHHCSRRIHQDHRKMASVRQERAIALESPRRRRQHHRPRRPAHHARK